MSVQRLVVGLIAAVFLAAAYGHHPALTDRTSDVTRHGLNAPVVPAWNRTEDTWCIYHEVNLGGDEAKVDLGFSCWSV